MPYTAYRALSFNRGQSEAIVSSRYAKGVRNLWKKPPCLHVDSSESDREIQYYMSKYVSKSDKNATGDFVKGRCWGCSNSVKEATKILRGDKAFNEFWFNICTSIFKRKSYSTDFFTIVFFPIHSLFAWYPDIRDYIMKKLREAFTPCRYYCNYLGVLQM